ncbi:MAG TPA: tRNA lysidine(34) synthetase TilS [Candidatus Methylacidiphilales bacterium]|jgi:tRNA(Ile)-lysidine synthetase-like protein|nr:tRNA lysidine(34) synthetase TilS [Candidatus Methylacidiphilales bacterium]
MSATPHPCEAALAALPAAPLLAAISGGIDSVALLHALVAAGRKPTVLHFDHGWRQESAADAKWVRNLARGLGLKCILGKMRATKSHAREAAARAARYAFFAQAARKLRTPHLVLAHHADDQVETFLLQLLRGSGAAGRGMDPVTTRDGLVLHRPWLALWKKDILAYARQRKLTWRDDPTNADTRHRRNLLRRDVLPYLRKKIGPHVESNLWRAAEIARAESEWLDALCAQAAPSAELAVKPLRSAPPAQQRRSILRWLQSRGIADITFANVEAIRALLTQRDPAKINLSANKHARRRAGKIFIQG